MADMNRITHNLTIENLKNIFSTFGLENEGCENLLTTHFEMIHISLFMNHDLKLFFLQNEISYKL